MVHKKNDLRVWVTTTGEMVPIDSSVKLGRSSSLALMLAQRGHSVTCWTSSFSHARKVHLDRELLPDFVEGVSFRYLTGRPYQKNISLDRVLNHREEARSFLNAALNAPRPDVIVCCLPTLDLAEAATRLGKLWGIPVLVDIRDMWPEIFTASIPGPARFLAPLVLGPFYQQLRHAASAATGIVGVSQGLVDYALSFSGRQAGPLDAVFPLAFHAPEPTSDQTNMAAAFWEAKGVGLRDGRLVACYAGALTRRACSDLLRIAKLFHESASLRERWKLVICGGGELEPDLRAMSSDSVELYGWVNQFEVGALLERAQVGIIPYPSAPDFLSVCPNKFGAYLNSGLPVVSHLDGEVGRHIREADCGWIYETDEDFINALAEVEADPKTQAMRRIRARQLFQREFQSEEVYRAFAAHVEIAAAHRP